MIDLLHPFDGVIISRCAKMLWEYTHTHTHTPAYTEPRHVLVGLSTVKVTHNKHALM